MRFILCFIVMIAAFGSATSLETTLAEARGAAPESITMALVPLDYVDTSGEANSGLAAHQRRLHAFIDALGQDLSAHNQYRIVPIACGTEPCSARMDPLELQKAAQKAGARFVLIGGIHKMSTLVQWAKIQIMDADRGRIALDRLLTFRGDTDRAWKKAEAFVAEEMLTSLPRYESNAHTSGPTKLAVFEFGLQDFSAGAGIAGNNADDAEQLRRATNAAQQALARSGRYSLVDMSHAGTLSAKVRKYDDCNAPMAAKLGAEQSLVGIVTRISRMEYTVAFRLCNARTGTLITAGRTDLRMGANYSWDRGAAWLIKTRLLTKHGQE